MTDPDFGRRSAKQIVQRRAENIAREHVMCNVTGLVAMLADEHGDEWAHDLMYGNIESPQVAYDAYEVWIVSDWLMRQLQKQGHRVARLSYQNYWARGAAGQAVAMDTVIEEIAKTMGAT